MFMSDYDIALCDKLYDFRENFEEDNIYCYWILLTLINEIFLNQEQEVSINVKENLKNTLNILLQFYELRQESNIIDWNVDIDLSNKDEIINVINRVYDIIAIDTGWQDIVNEHGIHNFFNKIINQINNSVNEEEINLPFTTQSEWEEEIENALNDKSPIPELRIPNEQAYHLQKNPKFLKEYIYRTGLLQYKCANCGLEEWQNEPISLILDFKDGNPRNQNLMNIQFLCPNCYSQIGKDFE